MAYRTFHWVSPVNNVIPFPNRKRLALVQQNSVETFVKQNPKKLSFLGVLYTAFLCVIFGPGITLK
jgi:hypothetical protein